MIHPKYIFRWFFVFLLKPLKNVDCRSHWYVILERVNLFNNIMSTVYLFHTPGVILIFFLTLQFCWPNKFSILLCIGCWTVICHFWAIYRLITCYCSESYPNVSGHMIFTRSQLSVLYNNHGIVDIQYLLPEVFHILAVIFSLNQQLLCRVQLT